MCTSVFVIPVIVTICTHLIAHSREFQRAEEWFLISTSHFTNGETRAHVTRELAKISQKVIRKFRKKSQGSPPHLDTRSPTCRCCLCHSRKPGMENRSQTPRYNTFCQITAQTLVLKLSEYHKAYSLIDRPRIPNAFRS